ncbi:hypothetical protein [Cecembia calidifontis]|uniref:Uncharacterized protein n=1 Tax=Cecembia calidifontis TaxID=1187080 RepID=A0A4Q7PB88_9BACT|nr:hypothetical protein [Cecembia calidifontis]RZS97563.1 hypothetical protein BC751_3177 [Cecembia calidifontis]
MKKKLKEKWLAYAVSGILLMGFGLSLMGEATILKWDDAGFLSWFGLGTLALAIFFAGLSLFGQATVFKSKIDKLK